jgi:hypothetical protein
MSAPNNRPRPLPVMHWSTPCTSRPDQKKLELASAPE